MNTDKAQIIGGICPLCGGGVWYKPKRVMTRPVWGMVNGSLRLMHKKCAMVHGLKEKENEHEKERDTEQGNSGSAGV